MQVKFDSVELSLFGVDHPRALDGLGATTLFVVKGIGATSAAANPIPGMAQRSMPVANDAAVELLVVRFPQSAQGLTAHLAFNAVIWKASPTADIVAMRKKILTLRNCHGFRVRDVHIEFYVLQRSSAHVGYEPDCVVVAIQPLLLRLGLLRQPRMVIRDHEVHDNLGEVWRQGSNSLSKKSAAPARLHRSGPRISNLEVAMNVTTNEVPGAKDSHLVDGVVVPVQLHPVDEINNQVVDIRLVDLR